MFLPGDCEEAMKTLGDRLRTERLRRNESQRIFAGRIGASIPTLLKMERGDPTVQFGLWINALDILDRLGDLGHVLAPPDDLFLRYEIEQQMKNSRKRASRCRKDR